MHGIRKLTEDAVYSYYESEHGIKVVPHSGGWSGYYRLGQSRPAWELILIAFCEGKAPPVIRSSIRSYEDLSRRFAVLTWSFDGQGEWSASSAINDDGSSFDYRIGVCDDGSFDVSQSDSELIGNARPETFPSLADAQGWCNNNEFSMVKSLRDKLTSK